MTNGSRLIWADHARGLAIICVVLCHTVYGLISAGLMQCPAFWPFLDRYLTAFQIPVFFFLSGVFAERSFNKAGFGRFLLNKTGTILYPYALWQVAQVSLMLLVGGTHHVPTLSTLLLTPVLPYMQFWFIYALFLCLVVYGLWKSVKLPNVCFFFIACLLHGCSHFLPATTWPPFVSLCEFLLYFSLGVLLSRRLLHPQIAVRSNSLLAILMVVFYGATVGLMSVGRSHDVLFLLEPVSACSGIAGTLVFAVLLSRSRVFTPVAIAGQYSLHIYVLHTIAAAGGRIVLVRFLSVDSLWIHFLIGFAAAFVGPLLLAALDQRWQLNLFRIPLKRAHGNVGQAGRLSA